MRDLKPLNLDPLPLETTDEAMIVDTMTDDLDTTIDLDTTTDLDMKIDLDTMIDLDTTTDDEMIGGTTDETIEEDTIDEMTVGAIEETTGVMTGETTDETIDVMTVERIETVESESESKVPSVDETRMAHSPRLKLLADGRCRESKRPTMGCKE